MEGVDIYNPVDNSITPTKADKVAAWSSMPIMTAEPFVLHSFLP